MTLVVNCLIAVLAIAAALLCLAGVYGIIFSLVRERKILRENPRDGDVIVLSPKEWRRWLERLYATTWGLAMAFIWANLAFVLASWLYDLGLNGLARAYMTVFAVGIVIGFTALGNRHNKLVYVLRTPEFGYRMSRRSK